MIVTVKKLRSQSIKILFLQIILFAMCFGNDSTSIVDPVNLLKEYLEKDAKGEFLRTSQWKNSIMQFPESVPAWDHSTLITSYQIVHSQIDEDTAIFDIHYNVVAKILQNANGVYLDFQKKTELYTFELIKSETGWKIEKPIIDQHIFQDAIIDRLSENDKKKIAEILKNK